MSRKLRFVPEGGALVEVTCRTIQGRPLLRPSQQLNDIFLGVLGRAQSRHPLEVVAYCCLSTHYHLLLRVDTAEELADFMTYFNGNLAKEVARLTGWKDKVWSRRYEPIIVSDEEEAQSVRKALYEAYGWFVAAYREAAEKLRSGDRSASFPSGSFPPRLPFVAV